MKQILNNLTDFLKKECEVWQKADKAFQMEDYASAEALFGKILDYLDAEQRSEESNKKQIY